ncbi:HAD family hydrolase [Desulfovibrio sp.]|uniref:HAD family hydrolase n=1 Tax=Desulfovibrio sp. TaxID=885 RepID=UPI0023C3C757|nr:HAD family hydrolase [Desulfovibrio sp.]MDE7241699.1 HAD family hydrolase [Desulfovibrio sp.]
MDAAFFDLDGTLLDTLADIGSACNRMLAAHGFPQHAVPAYATMVGNGFTRTVERALPEAVLAALSPRELEELTAEARAQYAAHLYDHTAPYAGMPEALTELAEKGVVLAVLSNKPDAWTEPIIRHFFPEIPFALIRGARSDLPLKPDPRVPRAMLDELDLESGRCAYVGDSDVDMLTARNAGMIPVGAAWGFRGAAELRAAGARLLAGRPAELPELLSPPCAEK